MPYANLQFYVFYLSLSIKYNEMQNAMENGMKRESDRIFDVHWIWLWFQFDEHFSLLFILLKSHSDWFFD